MDERFRLHRAGVFNVWQYDDQVFEFADGRLLLRGANGAGKSKTLEMLLPFVLDGDKNRITASGKHHTSLLWLMTDGHDGQSRLGYLWVEFARRGADGQEEWLTCGIGVRASHTARAAACWYFTTSRRVGLDLMLEDDAGPLSKDRCAQVLGPAGQVFDSPRQYKEHVGRVLFGLDAERYDDLLRLLYWLRQPQVGEDLEPAKLAGILSVALPELDEVALRSAGDTFEELAAFGEQLERRSRAAEAMAGFAAIYEGYARTVARGRGTELVEAHRELRRRTADVGRAQRAVGEIATAIERVEQGQAQVSERLTVARARLRALEDSPEAKSQQRLFELEQHAKAAGEHADLADRTHRDAESHARQAEKRLTSDAGRITGELRQRADDAQRGTGIAARLGLAGALTVPSALLEPVLADPGTAQALTAAIEALEAAAASAGQVIGERLATVSTVRAAWQDFAEADRVAGEAGRAAEAAAQRAEHADVRRADAEACAAAEEFTFTQRLAGWRAGPAAVPVDFPDALDAGAVPTLPGLARQAAEPGLRILRDQQAMSAAQRVAAEQQLDELQARHAAVQDERDPAPPPPALPRTPRDDLPGAALWQLIDFPPEVEPTRAAALEAALEASGMLDAWVRPDGRLLDADRRDVALPLGQVPVGAATLADFLVPAGEAVDEATVRGVLSRVVLVEAGAKHSGAAAVSLDGRWWLGPLAGRANKPAAQYVGVAARAAERMRRLTKIEQHIAAAETRRAQVSADEAAAQKAADLVERWLADFPPYAALITSWSQLDVRGDEAARTAADAREAGIAAEQERTVATERHTELDRLATTHRLPAEPSALDAARDELRELDTLWRQASRAVGALRGAVQAWAEAAADLESDRARIAELATDQHALRDRETAASASYQAEREKVGASVADLERKLAATRADITSAEGDEQRLNGELRGLVDNRGEARARAQAAEQRRGEQAPILAAAGQAVAGLADVPGLLGACGVEVSPLVAETGPPPVDAIRGAERLACLDLPREVAEAVVWTAHRELTAGPAAEAEPRIVPIDGLLAALARDDAGEDPVADVAARLAAKVRQDRELLTERERRLFEEHLLGELGDVLRARRADAEELVAAMNELLSGVTTTQGIRVRLDWRLRDDVGEDARRAVTLLGKPLGALLPEERHELRDALHRLIETSRAEEPDLSYADHLSRSLDYRKWFAFRIRYTRPETPGNWVDLHRRSPLSQGEQKVLCYLPLFAAAAAHFTSLAGAAPHAPRFVLLDDAFPKIDVRTHPLLFGLLVDLDLDFVITSERLWGDHATVPSLSIYEALRDPAQRGIAQYRHVWDGQRLRAVG
jgi:uncharacterized protein (TIGR02680 family)